jgi:putative mRNA 3-end processing factor
MHAPLVIPTEHGLYCAEGDFHIDPWKPVQRAVVTHAHSDHATPGCASYLCAARGLHILQRRVASPPLPRQWEGAGGGSSTTLELAGGPGEGDSTPLPLVGGVRGRASSPSFQPLDWNTPLTINNVRVSLHPAGHILGSAQVRIEHKGRVTVVSGDYKTDPDPTCDAFEPVACDTFITESTFGLPIYRWPAQQTVFDDINAWWRECQSSGRTAILFAYALGKAQRLLAGVDRSIGPILVHGALTTFDEPYRAAGVDLPTIERATIDNAKAHKGCALVLAPPSANDSRWLRKFGPVSLAMASGWMRIRGTRRRRALDRGFVLSDHADWPGLLSAIEATGATFVGVTHGYTRALAKHLESRGVHSFVVPTRYTGETDEALETSEAESDGA